MALPLLEESKVDLLGWDEVSEEDKNLIVMAAEVRPNAVAAYSNYKVGAAILWRRGNISKGVNVENAIYNVLHAEKGAIGSGIAEHGLDQIKRVAVFGAPEDAKIEFPLLTSTSLKFDRVARSATMKNAAVSCGQCLQDILEFSYGENVVMMQPWNGIVMMTSLDDLLPANFGPHDLGINYRELEKKR